MLLNLRTNSLFKQKHVLNKYKMINLNFALFRPRCLSFPFRRYRDDENESDDEVDWKELAKAIEEYQTLNGLYSFSFKLSYNNLTKQKSLFSLKVTLQQ